MGVQLKKPNPKLKLALFTREITQAELARAIGKSPSHVCRIIRGVVRARKRDRDRIAEFLGARVVELFD